MKINCSLVSYYIKSRYEAQAYDLLINRMQSPYELVL